MQDFKVDPNVGAYLVFDLESKIPHIVYYTNKAVKKNQELVTNWGGETWERICEIELNARDETSIWYVWLGGWGCQFRV
jgi:SET domain-containing protein